MLPQLKGQHYSALRTAGVLILLAAGLWFAVAALAAEALDWVAPAWVKWLVWATAGPVGIGLIVVRWYLGLRYDPNSQPDVERRREIGRQRVAADAQSFAAYRLDDDSPPVTQQSSEAVIGVQNGLPAAGIDGAAIRME